jgi:hypothetical protein
MQIAKRFCPKEDIIMGRFGPLVRTSLLIAGLACVFVLSATAWATADVAVIETTVPLVDSSQQSINAALDSAIDSAVRGAKAMGLGWIALRHAYVRDGYVGVQLLAATEAPGVGDVEEESQTLPETDAWRDGLAKILYAL